MDKGQEAAVEAGTAPAGERQPFRIPVGDWSNDGHGKCDWFNATATKPIEAVREAYFAAKKKLPLCCPEDFCSEYEDREIDEEIVKALRAAGAPLPERLDNFDRECMARVVVWFINQGDVSIDVCLEPATPMFPFYGHDKKRRHIEFIGYGLFS